MPTITVRKKVYADMPLTSVKALGEGVYEGIVATSAEDRHGEVLDIKGLDTKAYMSTNPIVLFAHNYNDIFDVMGTCTSLKKTKDGELVARWSMSKLNPKAMLADAMIKAKELNMLSIGFVPQEIEGNTYTKSEMVEFSIVPVPANAQAAITGRELGLSAKELGTMLKGAISSDLPLADESKPWDAGAAKAAVKEWAGGDNLDFKKYRKAFFWVDPENADKQGGYKLPFATVEDGELKAVWRGVAAAYAAVQGARGGVDIPDSDKAAVLGQIKKYYKKFGKDVPKAAGDEAIVTKADNIDDDARGLLVGLLADLAQIDTIVDAWQPKLASYLGVANPDDEGVTDDEDNTGGDMYEEGEGQDAGSASNTVRDLSANASVDLKSIDSITDFVGKLKAITGVLEVQQRQLSLEAGKAPVKKRIVHLVAVKQQVATSVKQADRMVEAVLAELKNIN